jgi:hypothetical protein
MEQVEITATPNGPVVMLAKEIAVKNAQATVLMVALNMILLRVHLIPERKLLNSLLIIPFAMNVAVLNAIEPAK